MMKLILALLFMMTLSACTKGSKIDDGFLGGVTLSLEKSTLTSSGTEIPSGNSVNLTLSLKDDSGNLFWIPNSTPTVTFETSGGTSSGIFTNITNNNDGTFSALFSGVNSGTATSIVASINGYAITSAAPSVTVTPGGYSLLNSYVTLSANTVNSSSGITATFHAYDTSNNPLTSGGLNVSFRSNGGGSTGTFGTVTDNNDGTYTAVFTGVIAGSATNISAAIAGQSITSSLPSVTVNSGPAATISVASGNTQNAVVATAVSSALNAIIKDANGNTVSGTTVDWTVTGDGSVTNASSTSNGSGIAANGLTVGTVTGAYTVTATIHGLAASTNFTATATPGLIDNFLLSSVPASATAGSAFNFTVTARDSYNNIKTDYTGVVHFASTDSGSPTLPANYTFVSGDNGTKQFSFTLKTTGNQTITVNQVAGGVPTETSSNINVSAGAATQLAIINGPSNTVAGTAISTMLVRALDAYGNTATSFNSNITLSISTNAGSGTLSGTTTVQASNGSASFPGLSINKTGTGYTLVASSTGLTSFTSGTFNITPSTPSSIAVVSGNNQTGTVGTALGSALVAVVKDANNNVVPSTTVTWTTNAGNIDNASVSTDALGQASNTCTLGQTAGANTITATVQGTAISVNFTATGTASTTINSIAWQTAPATSYTASNSAAMTTFTAKLLDVYGNTIASNSSTTVTLSVSQGTGSLGGTVTRTASSGVITFNNITYTKAEDLRITATDNTANKTVTSSVITVSPASPSTSQSTIVAGAASVSADGATPVDVTITLKDAYGNVIPSTTTTFASTGSGNTLTQPASQTNATGEALGSMVSSQQGAKTLSIASPAGLTSVTTTVTFVATAAVPANSTIVGTGPVTANGSSTSTVTITLNDNSNNPVTGVTPSFSASGTNNSYGSCTATDGSGVSTCTMTSTKAETKTLSITGPISKTGGTVSFVHGAASQIAWSTQPSGGTAGVVWATQGIATIQDANGNTVTTGADATATVTLSLQTGTGSLLGTTSMAAVAGVANFSGKGLKINASGNKVIRATKDDLSGGGGGTASVSADSNSISISAAATATLSIANFTSPSTAGSSRSVTVSALDSFGNTATSYTGTVHFTSNDGQAVLPSDYTFVSGDAGTKSLSGFILKTAGSTLSITGTDTVTGSITGSQANITINAAAADHLAKVAGDSQSATVGTALATNPKVQLLDAYENPVAGTVLTFTPSAGTVGAGTVTTDASGFASTSFTQGTVSGSNTLTVARQTTALPGSPATVSFTATGTPAAATTLAVSGFTTSVIAGSSNSITVAARDTYNNLATGYTGTISFTSDDGQAVLPGNYTFTSGSGLDNGTHTFTGLKLKTAGTKSITATDTVTGTITGSQTGITVSASTADHLALTAGDGQTAIAGSTVATNPKVQLLDAYGNAVAGTSIAFTVASGGGSVGTASVASDSDGYASTTYTLGTSSGSNTMTAARSGTALPGAPATITFTETGINGPATQLVFTTQPTGGVAESVNLPAQPVVEIRDANDNVVNTGTDATANITLSLSSGTGALSGTLTVAAVNGVATFAGISVDTQGAGKVITATKANTAGSGGTTSKTKTSNSFTINPPTPSAFTISSAVAGDSSVVLSWSAATNASTYTVKYGTVSGTYGTTVSTNATSPLTISSLTPGTTYYFMVQAVNVTGTRNATSEASSTPLSAFTISSITVNTGNKLRVTFGSSTGATSYTVKFGTSSGTYGTTDSTSATSPYDIASLTGGTTYYVMVTAVNSSGSVNATLEKTGIPINAFTATSLTSGVGTLSLAFNSATGATSYDALYDTVSRTATQSYASSSTGITSPASLSLAAGTTYYARARANNAYGSVVSTNELSGASYQNFTLSVPFTSGSDANYNISSATNVELSSAGYVRLKPASQTDSDYTAAGFAGVTSATGVQWDSTLNVVRLDTTTNNSQMEGSWSPQWVNLVGYWRMNGTSGNSIANNATITATTGPDLTAVNTNGTGMAYTTSQLSQGITLDGTDDTLSPGNTYDIYTSSGTISMWIKTSSNHFSRLASKSGTGLNDGWFFGTESNGNWSIGIDGLVTTAISGKYSDGRWHHVVARWSRGSNATILLDAKVLANFDISSKSGVNVVGTGNFTIGSRNGTDAFFNGSVDEVGVWGAALSDAEVIHLYQRQGAKYSGNFLSRIMDSQETGSTNNTWTDISLSTTLPFSKELPGSSGNESSSVYSSLAGTGLATNLTALYHFNDPASWNGTAGEVLDSSGNNNHGYRTGTAAMVNNSKWGTAATFNATSDSIIVGTGNTYINTANAPFTEAVWIFPFTINTTTTIDYRISSIHNAAGSSTLAFGLGNTDKLMIYNGSNSTYYSSTGSIPLFTWTHVAVTYSGTCFQFYINGIADGSCITANLAAGGSTQMRIGSYLSASSSFKGHMDEFGLWSRALSTTDMYQLYRRGANRVKYQVRTCSASDCSDQVSTSQGWKGPDGTQSTYFSEYYNTNNNVQNGTIRTGASTMTFSNFASLTVSNNRYFQYRTILESDDTGSNCTYGGAAASCSPEIKSFVVGPNHYPASGNITTSAASVTSAYVFINASGFSATLGANGCSNGVRYSISPDGTNYYYWNGSTWAASSAYATANDSTTMAANINSFPSVIGTGTLKIKTYLTSTGTSACEVDSLSVTGQKY